MLPDFDRVAASATRGRARRPGSIAELLIDAEEDRMACALLVGCCASGSMEAGSPERRAKGIPEQLSERWSASAEGRAWLDQLPSSIRDLKDRWSLRLGEAFAGRDVTDSWVAIVE